MAEEKSYPKQPFFDEQLSPLSDTKEQARKRVRRYEVEQYIQTRYSGEALTDLKERATSILKAIIGVDVCADDRESVTGVVEKIGELIGTVETLDKTKKVLVWSFEQDEKTLEFSWVVQVKAFNYQPKKGEAIITPDKANDLFLMLFKGKDNLVVDLHQWFSYGVVDQDGELVWQQKDPPFELLQLTAMNHSTRFEAKRIFAQPLLERAREMEISPDDRDMRGIFSPDKKARKKFGQGLRGFPDELQRFLIKVSEVVKPGDGIDIPTALTAFYLRTKTLAIVGKVGRKKDRTYWNGIWTAACVLAGRMGMKIAETSIDGPVCYKQGGEFSFRKPVKAFAPVKNAVDLLERVYAS